MTSSPPAPDPTAGKVQLRYWASLRAEAGTSSDRVEVAGPVSVASLLDRARELHPSRRFAELLATCSILVGDRPLAASDARQVSVGPGESLEFLPPFAGG